PSEIFKWKEMKENLGYEGMKIVKKLSSNGGLGRSPFPDAMFFLAECHGSGFQETHIDHHAAFTLYNQASKLSHPESTYRTAVCYEIGAGTKKDTSKAVQFYRKAAALGETTAMYKYGMILLKGQLDQTKNLREAVTWLKRAKAQADKNTPHAIHELALLHEDNGSLDMGIIPDPEYAHSLYLQAAQYGYAPSQYKLGLCYEYGQLGQQKDPKRSIAWYTRAAAQEDPESMLALSSWYLTGVDGVLEQSDRETFLWAQKSAETGLAKAEYAVGYYFEHGIGVKINIKEAKKWYTRAASKGNQRARDKLRDIQGSERLRCPPSALVVVGNPRMMNAPFTIRSQFQNVFRSDKDVRAPSPVTPVTPKMTFVRSASRTPSPEPNSIVNDSDNASSINYYDVYGADDSFAEFDADSIHSDNTIVRRIDRSFDKDELASRLERLIKRRSSGSSNGSRRSRYSVRLSDEPDISPIASYQAVDKAEIERIRSLATQNDYTSRSLKTPKGSPTKTEANIDMINAAVDEALAELQNGTGTFQEKKIIVIPQSQSPKQDKFATPPSHYVPPPRTPRSRAQSQDEVLILSSPPPRSGFVPTTPSASVLNTVPVASPTPAHGFIPSNYSLPNANNVLDSAAFGLPPRSNSSFVPVDSDEARDSFAVHPRRSRSLHGPGNTSRRASFEFKAEQNEQLPTTNIYVPPRRSGSNFQIQPTPQVGPMPDTQHRPEINNKTPLYRNLVHSPPPKLHVGQRIPEESTNDSIIINERPLPDDLPSVWPRTSNTEYRSASKTQAAKLPVKSHSFDSITPDTASTSVNDNVRMLNSFDQERGKSIDIEDEFDSRTSKNQSMRSTKSSYKSEKGED
ncbi:hypothetical protein HK096_004181, partial [Nowakowskiella sp. JEL0078]